MKLKRVDPHSHQNGIAATVALPAVSYGMVRSESRLTCVRPFKCFPYVAMNVIGLDACLFQIFPRGLRVRLD